MAGLEQSRHPMGFAVAASTASGLLVVTLTTAAERAFRWWSAWHGLLPLVALGWALATLPLVLRAARRGRRPRQVFLIVAAFTHKHWVAQLIRDLHENLERRGFDMVLKIPDRDYSGASQVRLLDGILRRRRAYAGGFIMVNEGQGIHADLARFCERAGMPVIFVDAEPFETEDAYPPGTAYVGCDDAKIGATAGQWVARYLRGKRIKRGVVLAVNGGCYPQREQAFCKQLQAELPDVQVTGDCAGFDRARARDVVTTHLRQFDAANRRLHAIFCTNDEMALGAADALLFAGIQWATDTVVAGVDGTPDARALIEARPSPLRATVIQDSYKVAETAVALMERMLRNEHVPRRTTIPAELLARDLSRSARHRTAAPTREQTWRPTLAAGMRVRQPTGRVQARGSCARRRTPGGVALQHRNGTGGYEVNHGAEHSAKSLSETADIRAVAVRPKASVRAVAIRARPYGRPVRAVDPYGRGDHTR